MCNFQNIFLLQIESPLLGLGMMGELNFIPREGNQRRMDKINKQTKTQQSETKAWSSECSVEVRGKKERKRRQEGAGLRLD